MPERVNVRRESLENASAMWTNHATKAQDIERRVEWELSKRRKVDWNDEHVQRERHKIRKELLGRPESKDERKERLTHEKSMQKIARKNGHAMFRNLSNKHAMFRNPDHPRYVPNDKDGRGKDPTGRRDAAELRIARKIDGRGVSDRPFRVRAKSFDQRFTTPKHAAEFAMHVWHQYGEQPTLVHYGKKRFKRVLRTLPDLEPWIERFNVNVDGTILEYVATM